MERLTNAAEKTTRTRKTKMQIYDETITTSIRTGTRSSKNNSSENSSSENSSIEDCIYTNIVPIWIKLNLTVKEASEYSGVGQSKIEQLLKRPGCTFLFMDGNRRLVKRDEFEKYIKNRRAV